MLRLAAIHTGPVTHLDHLAPLCTLMEMPLFVIDEESYRLGRFFYPEVDIRIEELSSLSLDFFATKLDAIFTCGKFWASELPPLIDLFYGRRLRVVHCPHGNSDKDRGVALPIEQDIAYVYGEHMAQLLRDNGGATRTNKMIRIGNIRRSFYETHRAFYDAMITRELPALRERTLLYAPSWEQAEDPAPFFADLALIIEQLAGPFYLIIKLHPFIEEDYPAQSELFISRYAAKSSLLFLSSFPLIYPLLQRCALYVGDLSSLSYDFLSFNRPLYFLPAQGATRKGDKLPIHACGWEIPEDARGDLFRFIEDTEGQRKEEFAKRRSSLYQYAFGEERDPREIRRETLEALKEKIP